MNNENNRTRKLNEVIGGADTDSLLVEVAELEPLSDEALGMVAGGDGRDDSSSRSPEKRTEDPGRSKSYDPGSEDNRNPTRSSGYRRI